MIGKFHTQLGSLLNLKLPTNLASSFDVPTISGVVGWTDTNAGKAEYEVYRSVNGGADTLLATTAKGATSYTDTGCKQNASVVYKIRAKIGTKVGDAVVATALATPWCLKTNQSVLTAFIWNTLNLAAGKSVTAKYSDGTSQVISGSNTNITKNFAVAGQYDVWLEGDINFITNFSHNSQSKTFGDISNWMLPSSLVDFSIPAISVSGNISNWILPSTLLTFNTRNTSLGGDISSWVLPNTLVTLALYSTFVSGDISNWILPSSLTSFLIQFTGISGAFPQITAHATNAMSYQAHGCNISDSNVTVFRKAMTVFNVSSQAVLFSTANINKLLKAIADWYQVNAPTANCVFTLSGANMGIPTGGASNADITRLMNYYTAVGKTATVFIRTS